VRLRIEGHHLPGRRCGAYDDVQVALQVRSDPVDPVPGDAATAGWETDVQVVDGPQGRDFRGPAVHGKRGERFVYLTWGDTSTGDFAMFRRAKLMLADAPAAEEVTASVHLTDECGMPRCARLREPAVQWRAGG
jgi:Family of unknown function (DUF5990)